MEFEPGKDDSRRREDAAIRLEQQFKDFLTIYEADKLEAKTWRITFDIRLKPIEDMKLLFERPAKIVGIILVLMITPFLGVIGWNIFKWSAEVIAKLIRETKMP